MELLQEELFLKRFFSNSLTASHSCGVLIDSSFLMIFFEIILKAGRHDWWISGCATTSKENLINEFLFCNHYLLFKM
jgi:hypothetical protein